MIFYTITMLPQDHIFSEYKQAFRELPHPAGTKFIASYNAFGALDKIRVMYKEDFPQGCDYRVAEIREYSGSQEKIESFYAAEIIDVLGESRSPSVLVWTGEIVNGCSERWYTPRLVKKVDDAG